MQTQFDTQTVSLQKTVDMQITEIEEKDSMISDLEKQLSTAKVNLQTGLSLAEKKAEDWERKKTQGIISSLEKKVNDIRKEREEASRSMESEIQRFKD
jgi:hypothetical protein